MLLCFGEVSLGLRSSLPHEMGFEGNLPSGEVKKLQGIGQGHWVQAGIGARLISDKSLWWAGYFKANVGIEHP